MAPPKQTDPQFKLRLPPELKERIEDAAEKNNRSMNAEIIARLDAFDDLDKLLKNFELAKERILAAQRIEASLQKQVEILNDAWKIETAHADKLMDVLVNHLKLSDDEILRPKKQKD